MRPLIIMLCAALLAAGPLDAAHAAKARAKKKPKTAKPAEVLRLNPGDMASPYSALKRGAGQTREAERKGGERTDLADSYQSNATSWKLDLNLTPKRPRDDSPLRFRVGQEVVIDPLTKKELSPRADPLKARQSLEDLDLKGALENMGGAKGEVQVDVLKF